jgi:hypothetical protein
VNASSYQKLCRPSVENLSTAAASRSAASGHHAGSAPLRSAATEGVSAGEEIAALTGAPRAGNRRALRMI